jgi:Xaa-Pro aminopeptidase
VPTAKLIIASSETSSDLLWATNFSVPDPIIFLQIGGKKILVASDLEFGRAQNDATVDKVLPYSKLQTELKRRGQRSIQDVDVIDLILKKKGIRQIEIPSTFPYRQAEGFIKKGYRLRAVPDPFFPERQIKSREEKRMIIKSLRATEEAIGFAIALLRKARVKSRRLYLQGSLLTSERLRDLMELKMMELGCIGRHTIVAGGRQAADPHCIGSGPLFANQPIVLDVFPRSKSTGYFGDITRTVVRGRPSDKIREIHQAVLAAQKKGFSLIRNGIDGSTVHQAVTEAMESRGFRSFFGNGRPQGFIHGTGHGLGLEIHEPPRIGRVPDRLQKGNVVTVEPGLYYSNIGGVRIEDVVYVTENGCEILTHLPRQLEIAPSP